MEIKIIFYCLILAGCSFYLGWILKPSHDSTEVQVAGVWTHNLSSIKQYYNGSFICVNIDEVKTLTELQRVCQHEVGHEIFARECESNFTNCLEIGGEK